MTRQPSVIESASDGRIWERLEKIELEQLEQKEKNERALKMQDERLPRDEVRDRFYVEHMKQSISQQRIRADESTSGIASDRTPMQENECAPSASASASAQLRPQTQRKTSPVQVNRHGSILINAGSVDFATEEEDGMEETGLASITEPHTERTPPPMPRTQPPLLTAANAGKPSRADDAVTATAAAATGSSLLGNSIDDLESAILADLEMNRQRFWRVTSPSRSMPAAPLSPIRGAGSGRRTGSPDLAAAGVDELRARVDAFQYYGKREEKNWSADEEDEESESDETVSVVGAHVLRSIFPPSPNHSRHERAHDAADHARGVNPLVSQRDNPLVRTTLDLRTISRQEPSTIEDMANGYRKEQAIAEREREYALHVPKAVIDDNSMLSNTMLSIARALELASSISDSLIDAEHVIERNAQFAAEESYGSPRAELNSPASQELLNSALTMLGESPPPHLELPQPRVLPPPPPRTFAPTPSPLQSAPQATPIAHLSHTQRRTRSTPRTTPRVKVNRHGSISINTSNAIDMSAVLAAAEVPARVANAPAAAESGSKDAVDERALEDGLIAAARVEREGQERMSPTSYAQICAQRAAAHRREMANGSIPGARFRAILDEGKGAVAAAYVRAADSTPPKKPWSPPGAPSRNQPKGVAATSPDQRMSELKAQLRSATDAAKAAAKREREAVRRARDRADADARRLRLVDAQWQGELFEAREAHAKERASETKMMETRLEKEKLIHSAALSQLREEFNPTRTGARASSTSSALFKDYAMNHLRSSSEHCECERYQYSGSAPRTHPPPPPPPPTHTASRLRLSLTTVQQRCLPHHHLLLPRHRRANAPRQRRRMLHNKAKKNFTMCTLVHKVIMRVTMMQWGKKALPQRFLSPLHRRRPTCLPHARSLQGAMCA